MSEWKTKTIQFVTVHRRCYRRMYRFRLGRWSVQLLRFTGAIVSEYDGDNDLMTIKTNKKKKNSRIRRSARNTNGTCERRKIENNNRPCSKLKSSFQNPSERNATRMKEIVCENTYICIVNEIELKKKSLGML